MGLNDYINKPVPGAAVDDPKQYADLKVALNQAFADNVNAIQIIANITSIVDTLVSRFAGVSPLAVIQTGLNSGPAAALAMIQQRSGMPVEPNVTDPTTGQPCPFTQAWTNVLKGGAGDVGQKIGDAVAKFLAGRK